MIRSKLRVVAALTLAIAASLTAAASASADGIVFNSIPKPLAGDTPSVGFEATGTSEFGGEVALAGTKRKARALVFILTSGACQFGNWQKSGHCETKPGASFPVDITARIYAPEPAEKPDKILAEKTQTLAVKYRPSSNDKMCVKEEAGMWYSKTHSRCYGAKTDRRQIKFDGQPIPDDAIVSISFDTTHSGYKPIGEKTECFQTEAGCGYDALGVALGKDTVTVGKQPRPEDAWLYSSDRRSYCDGGEAGIDVFRLDAKCWGGNQPLIRLQAG